MTDERKLTRLSAPPAGRRKPGSFNRSKMVALLKRQARARRNGNKPEPSPVWTSALLMKYAGLQGYLSVVRSRRLAGYRWGTPSRYL